MGHDWHNTVDGGGTLPCTTPSDGREGRDRETLTLEQEQLVKQVFAVNPRTIMVLVSSFPVHHQLVSQQYLPAILHMTHSLTGRRHCASQGPLRRRTTPPAISSPPGPRRSTNCRP